MAATEPHQMASAPHAGACMPVMLAADVQDALMTATHDLQRLQGLLEHAAVDLMRHFSSVHRQLEAAEAPIQPGDEDGETVVEPPPERPNPVTQDEMDAGSVELF